MSLKDFKFLTEKIRYRIIFLRQKLVMSQSSYVIDITGPEWRLQAGCFWSIKQVSVHQVRFSVEVV